MHIAHFLDIIETNQWALLVTVAIGALGLLMIDVLQLRGHLRVRLFGPPLMKVMLESNRSSKLMMVVVKEYLREHHYKVRMQRGELISFSKKHAGPSWLWVTFKRQHPCPVTGKSTGACPGYVIDHVKPLKRGGADKPSNMQWQTKEAAKAKDKWE